MKKPSIYETIRIIDGLGTVNAQTNRRLAALREQMPMRDASAKRPQLRVGLDSNAENMPNLLYDHIMQNHTGTQKDVWSFCGIGETEWTRFHQNKSLPDEKLLWRLIFGMPSLRRKGDVPLTPIAAKHMISLVEITEEADGDATTTLEIDGMNKLILGLEASQRTNDAFADAAEKLTAEYDEDTAQNIRMTLAAQAENPLMLFIYTHLPEDVRTNADIYRRCGISSDTWTQMKKNLRQPGLPVLVRLITGLRMTADEADMLLCIAWAQRSQFSGVLHGMWMSGVTDPQDIDEVLTYWFPEDKDMQLYGAAAQMIIEAKSNAMDELILRARRKNGQTASDDTPTFKANERDLALFRGYDDDEQK